MDPHILTLKRSKCDCQDNEPPSKTKKYLLDTDQTHNTEEITQQGSNGDQSAPQDHERAKDLNETVDLSQLISVWSDTQCVGNKALRFLQSRETIVDILLNDSVNKKFLEFHHDITEECGAEDKQHSWAVIEKREEVVMYGPYYPNYNKGKHSEDIIIKQTEELLESNRATEDWAVYVFTMNSPCLCRNSEPPCMLKLVQKAKEWWLKFRVKTNIGYKKCWGFKGTKETMFRMINYSQVQAMQKTENYEEYMSQNLTVGLLCENVFALLKNMLKSRPLSFDLPLKGQEWKSYFKEMQLIPECVHENDKGLMIEAILRMTEAAKTVSSKKCLSLEEHVARGQMFASDYSFNPQMTECSRNEIRLAFQKCWTEMVQDKYAEELRDTLTEDFNKCTNQLFIQDCVNVTPTFLHIGRVQFRDEVSIEYE